MDLSCGFSIQEKTLSIDTWSGDRSAKCNSYQQLLHVTKHGAKSIVVNSLVLSDGILIIFFADIHL